MPAALPAPPALPLLYTGLRSSLSQWRRLAREWLDCSPVTGWRSSLECPAAPTTSSGESWGHCSEWQSGVAAMPAPPAAQLEAHSSACLPFKCWRLLQGGTLQPGPNQVLCHATRARLPSRGVRRHTGWAVDGASTQPSHQAAPCLPSATFSCSLWITQRSGATSCRRASVWRRGPCASRCPVSGTSLKWRGPGMAAKTVSACICGVHPSPGRVAAPPLGAAQHDPALRRCRLPCCSGRARVPAGRGAARQEGCDHGGGPHW